MKFLFIMLFNFCFFGLQVLFKSTIYKGRKRERKKMLHFSSTSVHKFLGLAQSPHTPSTSHASIFQYQLRPWSHELWFMEKYENYFIMKTFMFILFCFIIKINFVYMCIFIFRIQVSWDNNVILMDLKLCRRSYID